MDTLLDLRSALQSDLNVSTNSSLFPETTIDAALNRAYITSANLFRWPQLSDIQKTSTVANREYYSQPSEWVFDSVWRLEVDGTMYGEDPDGSPMDYADYLIWKVDNQGSTEKKWTVFNSRYFIYPTPTVQGNKNITIWGQKNASKLINPTDVTVFSYKTPECNEAIVLEASAILQHKGEAEQKGQMMSQKAEKILALAFDRLKRDRAKYEKTQPFLNVPDFFGKSSTSNLIGRF